MPKRTGNALADRLTELNIKAEELAAIIRQPVEEIETWLAGDAEPDAESKILLRVLDQDHVATLAAERVRHMHTLPLRGGSGNTASVRPPYGGGHAGATGGQPA